MSKSCFDIVSSNMVSMHIPFFFFFFFSFMSECFYPYSKFINLFTPQEMPTYCIMTFQVKRKGELTLSIAATSFFSVTSTSSFSSVTSKCNTTKQLIKKKKKHPNPNSQNKVVINLSHQTTKICQLLI